MVSISLPGDAGMTFKPGAGLAAVQANCLTCHSSAYVSTQPVLSKAQWTAEVNKMRAVYAAPIADDQVAPIVDYLTAQYGKP
ncbi:MAG: cytochrome c [Candidatus Eremiobacteraeota bacterium]|nr:cytochrome c [Candidatus Eremiobacteraeota bacterium]